MDLEDARLVCPISISGLEESKDAHIRVNATIFNRIKKSRFSVQFEFDVNEPLYPFGQLQEVMGQGAGGGQPGAKGESTENINMNVKLEIVGNGEFAKLIDPRQFQQKIESIMMTSIGKTQVAQRFNSATNTKTASMGQLE